MRRRECCRRLAECPVPDVANAATTCGPMADARRVALFTPYYPSHGGGMEAACEELAHALLGAGLKVEWVSQADGSPTEKRPTFWTPVPGSDLVYRLSGVPMPLPMPWALPAIWAAARRARVAVIVEANFALSVIGYVAAKINRRPVLLVQHVGEPSTVSRFARLVMRIGEAVAVRPMVRQADGLVCVSPVVARHFAGERTKAEALSIGHGIDLKTFRPAKDQGERVRDREHLGLAVGGRLACFVGRLTRSKGIEVIGEMARLRPDWTFAIAGSGPVKPGDWNLPNIVVLGQLEQSEVARLYRVSNATVLPSQSESYSLVVREALASGSRVICLDQILESDPGLARFIMTEKVELTDVPATAARFAAALDAVPSASTREARDYLAEQCSRTAVAGRYVDIVQGLIKSDRAAAS